jgi:hypothetical protein
MSDFAAGPLLFLGGLIIVIRAMTLLFPPINYTTTKEPALAFTPRRALVPHFPV